MSAPHAERLHCDLKGAACVCRWDFGVLVYWLVTGRYRKPGVGTIERVFGLPVEDAKALVMADLPPVWGEDRSDYDEARLQALADVVASTLRQQPSHRMSAQEARQALDRGM